LFFLKILRLDKIVFFFNQKKKILKIKAFQRVQMVMIFRTNRPGSIKKFHAAFSVFMLKLSSKFTKKRNW